MILTVLTLAFALAFSPEVRPEQATPEAQARALVGLEYKSTYHGAPFSADISCTDQADSALVFAGKVTHEWAFGEAWCGDRVALLLKRVIGREKGRPIWRIVDTVLLPPFEREWTPRNQNELARFFAGDCRLDGRIDEFFVALARLGKRNRVDWRTGVKHAWTFDIQKERIVPVSTKRVVCHRPTPP